MKHMSILGKGGACVSPTTNMLKGHVPSCLVLVIYDNLYGLMVCLSYTLRFVHRQCLKIICWLQGWKEKIMWWPRCYSWSYPKIGHVRVEHIASMSWRRRSCLPSRHHLSCCESWAYCKLSILQACLEKEDCVNIHVYLQDITFMKRVGKIQGWSRQVQEWTQVNQHTKHRRCTLWDHVISRYGKHCPLCFVY